jgi:purine-binding chemotaxis protein CheW
MPGPEADYERIPRPTKPGIRRNTVGATACFGVEVNQIAPTSTGGTSTLAATRGGKYLTFALGQEEFGIGILRVREIVGFMEITTVPRTPAYVRGVINLRGQVISVIDLRARFGMQTVERTDHTCIVVVEIASRDGRHVSVGVVVDRVSEVLDIAADQIEDAPDLGSTVDSAFILGLAKVARSVKILLDIDRVLSSDELNQTVAAAAAA